MASCGIWLFLNKYGVWFWFSVWREHWGGVVLQLEARGGEEEEEGGGGSSGGTGREEKKDIRCKDEEGKKLLVSVLERSRTLGV